MILFFQWLYSGLVLKLSETLKKNTKTDVNLTEKGFLGCCPPSLTHLWFLFVLPFGSLRTKNSLDCEWLPVSWSQSFEDREGPPVLGEHLPQDRPVHLPLPTSELLRRNIQEQARSRLCHWGRLHSHSRSARTGPLMGRRQGYWR